MPLACAAVATPRLVKLPAVALDWEVTMPLAPVHPPPLRPDWIRPEIPSYTPAVAVPTGLAAINLLLDRSKRPALRVSVGSLLAPALPPLGATATVPPSCVSPSARRLFTTRLPSPSLWTVTPAAAVSAPVIVSVDP